MHIYMLSCVGPVGTCIYMYTPASARGHTELGSACLDRYTHMHAHTAPVVPPCWVHAHAHHRAGEACTRQVPEALLSWGVEFFWWLGPGEPIAGEDGTAWPDGAFIYLYRDGDEDKDCFFSAGDP